MVQVILYIIFVTSFLLIEYVVTVLLDKDKIFENRMLDFIGIWTQDLQHLVSQSYGWEKTIF